jgi:hypothetical protein
MKTGKCNDGTPLNFDRKMQRALEVETHKQSHKFNAGFHTPHQIENFIFKAAWDY